MDSMFCIRSGTFNGENSVSPLLHNGLRTVLESPILLEVDITDLLVHNRLFVSVRHSVHTSMIANPQTIDTSATTLVAFLRVCTLIQESL